MVLPNLGTDGLGFLLSTRKKAASFCLLIEEVSTYLTAPSFSPTSTHGWARAGAGISKAIAPNTAATLGKEIIKPASLYNSISLPHKRQLQPHHYRTIFQDWVKES
jgi:hypothetical protein